MKVALATSLHLDHGAMPPEPAPGQRLPMQVFVPVGLLSLKAYADRALGSRADIAVHELNTLIAEGAISNDRDFHDQLAAAVLGPGADVVGLMTDADSLHHTVLIADRIRARSPETSICIGGPTTSPMPRLFLERFPQFDLLIRGEGEATFAHLLETLQDGGDPGQVAGLSWRRGEEVVVNPERALIQDLDDLPIPAFEAYARTASAALYLDVGRGCPFKCRFCATAPFWNRRFRMKSAGRIIEEMQLLRDRWGRDHVNFSHDIFTANRRWTLEFCDAMEAASLGVTWSCSTRTDTIDEELLRRMAAVGCDEIYYGIESGSPAVQTRIDKNLDLAVSRRIVAETAAAGIRPVTGFIVGYPFETEETLNETLRTFFDFLEVGGYRAHLFTLCPFPEAPMFAEHADSIGGLAEYHDLPLSADAQAETSQLLDRHRDIFCSAFRFTAPDLEPGLVAASEEISPHLVLLRRIWPQILRHYETPLDWYRRWVAWIAQENLRRRRGGRLAHQGDVTDLLRFLGTEVRRLRIEGTSVASLIRYETIKHAAAGYLPPGRETASPPRPLGPNAMVVRTCSYLAAPFQHDLRTLLAGREPANDPGRLAEPSWVVFAKTQDGELHTLHTPPTARRLFELADRPRPLAELIDEVLLQPARADDSQRVIVGQFLDQLIACNLFSEDRPS